MSAFNPFYHSCFFLAYITFAFIKYVKKINAFLDVWEKRLICPQECKNPGIFIIVVAKSGSKLKVFAKYESVVVAKYRSQLGHQGFPKCRNWRKKFNSGLNIYFKRIFLYFVFELQCFLYFLIARCSGGLTVDVFQA